MEEKHRAKLPNQKAVPTQADLINFHQATIFDYCMYTARPSETVSLPSPVSQNAPLLTGLGAPVRQYHQSPDIYQRSVYNHHALVFYVDPNTT